MVTLPKKAGLLSSYFLFPYPFLTTYFVSIELPLQNMLYYINGIIQYVVLWLTRNLYQHDTSYSHLTGGNPNWENASIRFDAKVFS